MPQRSNDFQKLVLAIEQQLAASGTVVEESVMLPDNHDGTPREVDILLRIPAADRELRIGIECRDHARKADVGWVQYLKAHYDLLPVDRCVAVSRRGFSKTALAKARLFKIDTLTLEAASKVSWAALLQIASVELTNTSYGFVGPATILTVSPAGSPVWPAESSAILLEGIEGKQMSVQAFLDRVVAGARMQETIHEAEPSLASLTLFTRLKLGPGITAIDVHGIRHVISGLAFRVRIVREVGAAELTHYGYNKVAAASGRGVVGASPFLVTMTQRPGKAARGQAKMTRDGEEVVLELPGLQSLSFPDP